jgi:hypothetical protein
MDGPVPLPTLLSHTLVAFTIEFDNEFEHLVPHRRASDLPRLASVSKEATATALSFLTKRGYAAMKSNSAAGRTRVIALTAKGRVAQDKYR